MQFGPEDHRPMRLPTVLRAIGLIGEFIEGRKTPSGIPMKRTLRGWKRQEPDLYHDELPGNSGQPGDDHPWFERPTTRYIVRDDAE